MGAGLVARLRSLPAQVLGSDARSVGRHALVAVVLALRALDLAQGLVYTVAGAGAYERPWLALLVVLAACAESAWLARRLQRQPGGPAWPAAVDLVFNVAALLLLAAAIPPGRRSASVDWMLPYSVGSALLYAIAFPAGQGLLASAGLGTVYVASVAYGVSAGERSWVPIAAVNFLSYVGFYGVALAAARLVGWGTRRVDVARREAMEQGRELAAACERNRQHLLIHNEALQPLALVATGTGLAPELVRAAATGAMRRLVSLGNGHDAGPDGLAGGLETLVDEFSGQGLRIRAGPLRMAGEPDRQVSRAMLEAAREALTNVRKHAPGATAVLDVRTGPGAWHVVVSDDGPGFDEPARRRGFGLSHSIAGRMQEIGGGVSVRSEPGVGTTVTVSWPAARPAAGRVPSPQRAARWLREFARVESGWPAAWSAERALLSAFFLVRGVHLVQAAFLVLTSSRMYLHPDLVRAVFAAGCVESVAMLLLWWRRGRAEPVLACLDALFGAAGLVTLALALPPGAQQTSTNWMLQYSTGTALALAVALDLLPGLMATLLLGAVYWISVTEAGFGAPGPTAIAEANVLGYLGYFLVARIITALLRWTGRELDSARRQAVERSAEVAVEAERARYHTVIEPLAIRTLALVASDYEHDGEGVKAAARITMRRLRAVIGGRGPECEGTLSSGLAELAEEFQLRGLRLTIVTAEVRAEPAEPVSAAVLACVREALGNAGVHAPGARVTVRAVSHDAGGEATIRDDGPGLDLGAPRRWSGLARMERRMETVGGSAELTSEPGRGVVVRLRWRS